MKRADLRFWSWGRCRRRACRDGEAEQADRREQRSEQRKNEAAGYRLAPGHAADCRIPGGLRGLTIQGTGGLFLNVEGLLDFESKYKLLEIRIGTDVVTRIAKHATPEILRNHPGGGALGLHPRAATRMPHVVEPQ